MEDFGKKALAWFQKNLCFLIVILIVGIYFLRAFVDITHTGKTVFEILADGALTGSIGYIVALLFEKQGIRDGEESKTLKEARDAYTKVKNIAESYADKLQIWCDKTNVKDLAIHQKSILQDAHISWDEFTNGVYTVTVTDKNGISKVCQVQEEGLTGEKLKVVKKARRAKITPLTDTMLMTDTRRKARDPHYLGRDIHDYDRITAVSNLLSKLVFAILFGCYGVRLIENFTPAELIWTGIQVVTFLGLGFLSYMQAKLYMSSEYAGRYDNKKMYLNAFLHDIQVSPEEFENTGIAKVKEEKDKSTEETETQETETDSDKQSEVTENVNSKAEIS